MRRIITPAVVALMLLLPASWAWGDEVAVAVAQARGTSVPLRAELEDAAQTSASAQARADRLAHSSIGSLTSICHRVSEVVGAGPSVTAIFEGFRDSSLHWSKLVDPRWTAMGTGVASSTSGTVYISVVLCQENGATTPPPPTPTTTPGINSPSTKAPPVTTGAASTGHIHVELSDFLDPDHLQWWMGVEII